MKVTTAIVWAILILSYFGLKAYKFSTASAHGGFDPVAQRIEALPWFSDNDKTLAAVALACEVKLTFTARTNSLGEVTSIPVVAGRTNAEFTAESKW